MGTTGVILTVGDELLAGVEKAPCSRATDPGRTSR